MARRARNGAGAFRLCKNGGQSYSAAAAALMRVAIAARPATVADQPRVTLVWPSVDHKILAVYKP